MYISIVNFSGNDPKLDDFAYALHDVLFDGYEEDETFINIDFIDNIDDEACGFCFLDEDDNINIQVNNTLPRREQAITLAHEMVHARQIMNGVDFCEEEAYALESILTDSFYTVH